MIIGNFTYDPERDTYAGSIRTLSLDRRNVQLRPTRKSGDKEPDYRLVEDAPGGLVELGAAWKRRSEKGYAFLSIVLDDPALPQALNVALFDGEDGAAKLVWTRPRATAHQPEPETPAPKRKRPTAARVAGMT